MRRLWHWLLRGSDVQYLGRHWLADKSRIGHYVGYTRRQHEQGSVVKDVAACRREAFWTAQDAKVEARKLKVIGGGRFT